MMKITDEKSKHYSIGVRAVGENGFVLNCSDHLIRKLTNRAAMDASTSDGVIADAIFTYLGLCDDKKKSTIDRFRQLRAEKRGVYVKPYAIHHGEFSIGGEE